MHCTEVLNKFPEEGGGKKRNEGLSQEAKDLFESGVGLREIM